MNSYKIGFEKLGVDLRKLHQGKYTTCPFCSHNRTKKTQRCFAVNTKSGNYNCSHCGEKGRVDSDKWINDKHEKGQNETINPIMATKGEQQRIEKHLETKTCKPFTTKPLSDGLLEYFKGRGISESTTKLANVRMANVKTIAFNYIGINGKTVNAKYRDITKKHFFQHTNAPHRILYNLDLIAKSKSEEVIICEGEFDSLSFLEIGLEFATSISQGAPAPDSNVGGKLKCLENSSKHLKGKIVYIAVDNDAPGRYLEQVLVNRFGYNCRIVRYPKGCKDANEVLVKHGGDVLYDCYKNAQPPKLQGVTSMVESEQAIMDLYDNGLPQGVSCGWAAIDNSIKFLKGTWSLLVGMPNMGKSEVSKTIMILLALNHGWKFGVFTPEHHPANEFFDELISLFLGKNTDKNNPNRPTREEYKQAYDILKPFFFFIYPEDSTEKGKDVMNTPTNVLKLTSELVLSQGIDALIIDPYNQMLPEESGAARDLYLGKILGMIDKTCKKHNIFCMIVHHPKQQLPNGDGDFATPNIYSPNGGAMWNNKTYLQFVVHRPYRYSNPSHDAVTIEVQKVKKSGRMGQCGTIDLRFDPKTKWYFTMALEDAPLYGVFDKIVGNTCEVKSSLLNNYDDYLDEVPF